MSWSDPILTSSRRGILLTFAALAGCGFTPVYAPGGPGQNLRGRLSYDAPSTPEGFRLRSQLEDRLGRSEAPAYALSVALTLREDTVAISPDGATTRYTVVGEATYALRPSGSETVVAEGRVDNFTSYSATGSTVATGTARDDARRRLAVILADLIVTRLAVAPLPGQ